MQLFNVVSGLIVPMFMHEFVNNYVANYYFLDKAFSESEKRKFVKKLNSQKSLRIANWHISGYILTPLILLTTCYVAVTAYNALYLQGASSGGDNQLNDK